MGRSSVDDPLKAFRFRVEVDGFVRAAFMEVSGLESTTEVVEYREGGDNATVLKSPGLTSFANLVFKRGQFVRSTRGGDDDFAQWAKQVFDVTSGGAPMDFRRTLDIVQYHRDGSEAKRHRVVECWPTRFKPMGDLNATSNDNSIQELEVVNEGFTDNV